MVVPIYIPSNSEEFHFPFSPHTFQHLLFDRLFKVYKNCHTVALISHVSEVMLKILQAGLQQYMNQKFPYVQAGFSRGRGAVVLAAQWCLTFCDPMDCSPPVSCPWTSPGKDTGVACHFLLQR